MYLKKTRIVFLLPLIFNITFLFSQNASKTNSIDSLKLKFAKDSAHLFRFQNARPFLGIDNRNSWIKNENGTKNVPINVNGLQFGIIIKERHTVGLCAYSITNSSKKPQKLSDRNQKISYQNLKLGYLTLYYQYAIIDRRFFELDVPLEVGLGKYNYYLSDSAQNILPKTAETGQMRLTGGGVNIVLKPFKWIGISGMVGYRFVAMNKNSHLNLNGLYYSYGVWVDLRQIYRDTRFYLIKRPKYRKQLKRLEMES